MHLVCQPGDTIALVGNSNPLPASEKETVRQLTAVLNKLGIEVAESPLLFSRSTRHYQEKAAILNQYFVDKTIKAIFDISGGDMANSVLPFLNYTAIKNHPKPFFGYSDVTTVLNALAAQSGIPTGLFQLKTILQDTTGQQLARFTETFIHGENSLYDVDWRFIRGNRMSGQLIGGNIRCFLKLAGTPYLPPLKDRILFLESQGGLTEKQFSYFHQLTQLPDFQQLSGILLGTFTDYERADSTQTIGDLLLDVLPDKKMPVAKTDDVGHGQLSKALVLNGERVELKRQSRNLGLS